MAEINTKLHKQMKYFHVQMYYVTDRILSRKQKLLQFSLKGNLESIGYKNWKGWKSKREEKRLLNQQKTETADAPCAGGPESESAEILLKMLFWIPVELPKECSLFFSVRLSGITLLPQQQSPATVTISHCWSQNPEPSLPFHILSLSQFFQGPTSNRKPDGQGSQTQQYSGVQKVRYRNT